jgi:hypothetical protein
MKKGDAEIEGRKIQWLLELLRNFTNKDLVAFLVANTEAVILLEDTGSEGKELIQRGAEYVFKRRRNESRTQQAGL